MAVLPFGKNRYMFKPGEQVICVDDHYQTGHLYERFGIVSLTWQFPVLGQIYTVERVTEATITVKEIKNIAHFLGEPEFYFYHFEKLPEEAVLRKEIDNLQIPMQEVFD